mgnify:FL=1
MSLAFCSFAFKMKKYMRKLIYGLLLCFAAVGLAACGGKKETTGNKSMLAKMDSLDASGLQRMQVSRVETDVQFKGKTYRSVVVRTPDESLPHVSNEMGDTYVDNKIVLRLTQGNKKVVEKTFTKKDFASVVDAGFLAHSILEGIVYSKTSADGIVYAASVYYPQTDLYMPLSITVNAAGKIHIQKEDMLEEEYDSEPGN